MTDIVERLRDYAVNGHRPTIWPRQITAKTMSEAADEIERLRHALVNIDEIVEHYADADDGQPNMAMRVMTTVRAVLDRVQ